MIAKQGAITRELDSLRREVKRLEYLLRCAAENDDRIRESLIEVGEHPGVYGVIGSIRHLARKARGES